MRWPASCKVSQMYQDGKNMCVCFVLPPPPRRVHVTSKKMCNFEEKYVPVYAEAQR